MTFAKELSMKERKNYSLSYLREKALIAASILELQDRNRMQVSPGEKAENDLEILKLKRKRALVEADKLAFEANTNEITPPTPEQLSELSSLITQVDNLTAEGRVVDAVISLTTDGLNIWNEINGVA